MNCQRDLIAHTAYGCGRPAFWYVDGVALCKYHARKRPMEIVLNDFDRFRHWIDIAPLEGIPSECQHRQNAKCGSAAARYLVEGKPYCLAHTVDFVYGHFMHDNQAKRLIAMRPYRDDGDGREA